VPDFRTRDGAAAHARRRHPSASDQRLRELGAHAPRISPEIYEPIARERARRAVRVGGIVLLVAVVLVGAGVQWFRPVPAPVYQPSLAGVLRLPGAPPSLPWPATGAAALAVAGAGSLGSVGSTKPVPVAGLAKVMTAYVVLKDHPLAVGADGPSVPVSADAVASSQAEQAAKEATVPLSAGETLTELQALQGVMVASGNDMAVLLADWDAGTTAAFLAKMNSTARALGMRSTTFTDPSGLDAGTVSTPEDLVTLASAAMALPAFAAVVALPQVSLPPNGTYYNLNYDVGRYGIVGIKTGADDAAGGCFLFAARRSVAGQSVTLVGAVLGQRATPETGAAVDAGAALVKAAFAAAGPMPLLRAGTSVGQIVAPWGPSVPVTVAASSPVVAWPGLLVPVRTKMGPLARSLPAGTAVGTLVVSFGTERTSLVLRTAQTLSGPSAFWRLTRF